MILPHLALFSFLDGASETPFVASISVTLTDANNLPLASLSGLRWSWWDQSTVDTQVAPTVQGTGATTNGAGVLSVTTLSGSALTAGQTGWLEVTDSDGTVSTTSKVAAGPVTVT